MKDTAGLKSFATASRTALIEQMRGRAEQLLTDGKAQAEYPRELDALREAVDAHGFDWVADAAAYTWFNRLTAARYMDANEFSGPYGVVSPEFGSASTLPEILTRAQAGEFSDEVTSEVREAVTDILTGRRSSADPDAEAYALLLSAMFRSWHQPMPEVFPAAVDWIRLLRPVDMLAPTSVRARAVLVMDAEACENVEVVGWLYQFYNSELKDQINESKVSIDAEELPAVTQLFTPEYIVRYLVENSLGRLWLRSRPSSSLRAQMDYYIEPVAGQEDTGATVESPEEIRVVDPACGSGHMLTYAFDLLFAIYEEEGYSKSSIPQLILTHNLRGLEIDERAAQLASFALAMKARAKDRRFFSRSTDDNSPVQPDIVRVIPVHFDEYEAKRITGAVAPDRQIELARLLHSFAHSDTFGSLIRVDPEALASLEFALQNIDDGPDLDIFSGHSVDSARALQRQARALVDNQYHVVVANPPYLGSGNMGADLSTFAKKYYPATKADLYAMFIERNAELSVPSGSVAMVTMQSWMFISSYKKFRAGLSSWGHLTSMAHLGSRGFDSITGEVVQTTAFIIDVESRIEAFGTYVRLVEGRNEAEKRRFLVEAIGGSNLSIRFESKMSFFEVLPDSVTAYWVSEKVRAIFGSAKSLGEVATVRCGMNTGNNANFVREWWEPSRRDFAPNAESEEEFRSSGAVWCPYNKGGDARRWWGNQSSVLRYDPVSTEILENQGNHLPSRPLYFQSSVSWSKIGGATFRKYPNGFVFDGAGMSIYSKTSQEWKSIVGYLNSSVCLVFLGALAPTVNVQSGDVANIPVVFDLSDSVPGIDDVVSIFQNDWNESETSWDFEDNIFVSMGKGPLEVHAKSYWEDSIATVESVRNIEEENNRYFAELYKLEEEVECEVPLNRVSLTRNPYFRYAKTKAGTDGEYRLLFDLDLAKELISYAVGCMMGRYSLDFPGLILADVGSTIADFDVKVPDTRFRPDDDGILPITGDRYFEDDIVARLREFLSVAFGAENVEANVSWLEHALGSGSRKSLRDYFLKNFYDDHLKAYSKRPIYWQVSSNAKPEKGFNALVYLHRYTPATLGLVHQNYAVELLDKLDARLDTIEHALLTAGKSEATKLAKERDLLTAQRREIRDWTHNTLFPLASAEIELDLDDGVKQNYPKLKGVVRKVTGL